MRDVVNLREQLQQQQFILDGKRQVNLEDGEDKPNIASADLSTDLIMNFDAKKYSTSKELSDIEAQVQKRVEIAREQYSAEMSVVQEEGKRMST